MSYYCLVHVVVHGATDVQRKCFYDCLETKHWIKIHDHHITTLWEGIVDSSSYTNTIAAADRDFPDCAKQCGVTINYVAQANTVAAARR